MQPFRKRQKGVLGAGRWNVSTVSQTSLERDLIQFSKLNYSLGRSCLASGSSSLPPSPAQKWPWPSRNVHTRWQCWANAAPWVGPSILALVQMCFMVYLWQHWAYTSGLNQPNRGVSCKNASRYWCLTSWNSNWDNSSRFSYGWYCPAATHFVRFLGVRGEVSEIDLCSAIAHLIISISLHSIIMRLEWLASAISPNHFQLLL